MAKLQSRGLADGLQAELEGLDTDTALIFAKQINKMSDAEFNELNDAYKKLDEETSKLADDKYKKQLESLQTDFIDQSEALFQGMDADLKTLGVDGATAYVEGLTTSFEGSNIDDIKKQVDGLFDDITEGIREDSSLISGIVSDAFLIDFKTGSPNEMDGTNIPSMTSK